MENRETLYLKGGAIALGQIIQMIKEAKEKGYSIDEALRLCEEERMRWLTLYEESREDLGNSP